MCTELVVVSVKIYFVPFSF